MRRKGTFCRSGCIDVAHGGCDVQRYIEIILKKIVPVTTNM